MKSKMIPTHYNRPLGNQPEEKLQGNNSLLRLRGRGQSTHVCDTVIQSQFESSQRSNYWRSQETSQIQTWNRRSQRNQEISEVDWAPHPKTSLSEARQGNRSRFQGQFTSNPSFHALVYISYYPRPIWDFNLLLSWLFKKLPKHTSSPSLKS
jgi:hypothetical protein